MTINEAQDAVIGEFEDFTDWMDKYQMLIDLGNELEPLEEQYKNEQNLIDGRVYCYKQLTILLFTI